MELLGGVAQALEERQLGPRATQVCQKAVHAIICVV